MKNKSVFKMVLTAALAAVTVLLAFVPLKTLGLEITFAMVPVAVGAIVLGPSAGAVLGAVFGVVSYLQCLGYSPFGAVLFNLDPFLTFLVCVPTRTLAGWLSGLIFKALRGAKLKPVAHTVASLAAPLFNTVFFMGTLVLCFYNTEFIQGFVTTLGAVNPFMFIVLFVGINGLVELIAGFVVALPASLGVTAAVKRLR